MLQKVFAILPEDKSIVLSLFGSGPLSMGISADLVSADLDIIESPDLMPALETSGLLKGKAPFYVELCPPGTFTAATDWRTRAFEFREGRITVIFPHPIDILVSKVKRMAEKDFEAFETVIASTGHPTELELKESLQRCVDLFKPSFDEEWPSDPIVNTQLLWQRLFGKKIDVRKEIIAPALAARKSVYGPTGTEDTSDRLKRIGEGPRKDK